MAKRKIHAKITAIPLVEQGVRRDVLESALVAFAQLGSHGTTLSELSRRSGVAKSLILYHFEDVDSILVLLGDYWGETGRQITLETLAASDDPSPGGRVRSMIRGAFQWMRTHPEMARLTPALLAASKHDRARFRGFLDSLETGFQRLKGILKKRFRTEKEIERAALLIHSQLFGALLYLDARDFWERLDEFEHMILNHASWVIEGR